MKLLILKLWRDFSVLFHCHRRKVRLYVILPRETMLSVQRKMLHRLADRFRRKPKSSVIRDPLTIPREPEMESLEVLIADRVIRIGAYGHGSRNSKPSSGHRILWN